MLCKLYGYLFLGATRSGRMNGLCAPRSNIQTSSLREHASTLYFQHRINITRLMIVHTPPAIGVVSMLAPLSAPEHNCNPCHNFHLDRRVREIPVSNPTSRHLTSPSPDLSDVASRTDKVHEIAMVWRSNFVHSTGWE